MTRLWSEPAACTGQEWLFDHVTEAPNDRVAEAEAKAICARCPALTICRREALAAEAGLGLTARHGILGGLSPAERHAVENPVPPITNHGTTGGYWAHRRRREPACEPCLAANRDAERVRDNARRNRNRARAKSETAAAVTGRRLGGRRAS